MMNTNLPLEELILTLLALAEAAPHLDRQAHLALAEVAEGLQMGREGLEAGDEAGLVDLLSLTQVDIVIELYDNRLFKEAKTAWDQQLTVRVGLDTDDEWGQIPNPREQISPNLARDTLAKPPTPTLNFLQRLSNTVSEALRHPKEFAQNNQTLKNLASLVKLPYSR